MKKLESNSYTPSQSVVSEPKQSPTYHLDLDQEKPSFDLFLGKNDLQKQSSTTGDLCPGPLFCTGQEDAYGGWNFTFEVPEGHTLHLDQAAEILSPDKSDKCRRQFYPSWKEIKARKSTFLATEKINWGTSPETTTVPGCDDRTLPEVLTALDKATQNNNAAPIAIEVAAQPVAAIEVQPSEKDNQAYTPSTTTESTGVNPITTALICASVIGAVATASGAAFLKKLRSEDSDEKPKHKPVAVNRPKPAFDSFGDPIHVEELPRNASAPVVTHHEAVSRQAQLPSSSPHCQETSLCYSRHATSSDIARAGTDTGSTLARDEDIPEPRWMIIDRILDQKMVPNNGGRFAIGHKHDPSESTRLWGIGSGDGEKIPTFDEKGDAAMFLATQAEVHSELRWHGTIVEVIGNHRLEGDEKGETPKLSS